MPELPSPTNARPVLILLAAGNFALAFWLLLKGTVWIFEVGLGLRVLYIWVSWMFLCFVLNISFRIAMLVFIACAIAVFFITQRLQ